MIKLQDRQFIFVLLAILALGMLSSEVEGQSSESPRFIVPGEEQLMQRAEQLNRLHYPHAFTPCTLWDPWLPHATLWQANGEPATAVRQRDRYRDVFLNRRIDAEGYVSMQQHRGMAHSEGWPFPAYQQSTGRGWHFSVEHESWAIQHFRLQAQTELGQWQLSGADLIAFDPHLGMRFKCTSDDVRITTPPFSCGTIVAPFVRLEYAVQEVPKNGNACLLWKLDDESNWEDERSHKWTLDEANRSMHFVNLPLYRQPAYRGLVKQYQWRLQGCHGAEISLKSLITAVDTRHPITNSNFVRGSAEYFFWTNDRPFLQSNIQRMRRSLQFAINEFAVRENKHVVVSWVGHDGRSGLKPGPDPRQRMRIGLGVGNNYWDLLPFGGHDMLATIYLYDAIQKQIAVERYLETHTNWDIEAVPSELSVAELDQLARSIKANVQNYFWDSSSGRFVGWKDLQENPYDYGFTFVNIEAIHYGLASDAQATEIFDWLDGKREVVEDTSRGADIYAWRFAPRATTRRNTNTYAWVWNSPQSIPWGGQVQDGGAVLGFSYFDLMARLEVHGPDDAWKRFKEILNWFDEVELAGGYRAYYAVPGRGTLQGGGTAGGLGLDHEFMESALVPQVLLYGFMGFEPKGDTYEIHPRLPSGWQSLTIDRIHIGDKVIKVTAFADGTYRVEAAHQ